MFHQSRMVVAAGLVALSAASSVPVQAQEFTAKNVTLMVGFPPGGGYDTIARLFARSFGRHLPGAPGVVVQNLPGAGSLAAANLLYNVAPKDGSQIALFASSVVLQPMLGNQQAKFDPAQFIWVGNLSRDTPSCAASKATGIRTWDDMLKRRTRFGASGPSAITSEHAFFMRHVLKADIQVIMGLGGTGPIMLALQRGEVDATCGMFLSSLRGPFRSDYEAGNLVAFIQFGKEKQPYFKAATHVYDLVKTDDDRQLTEFVFSQAEVTRPLALPPGTPPSIVAALRAGFDKAVRDPDYLAELEKANIDAEPVDGAGTTAAFRALTSAPAAIFERAKAAVSPPKE